MLLPKLVWKNYGTLKENYDSKLFLKVKTNRLPIKYFYETGRMKIQRNNKNWLNIESWFYFNVVVEMSLDSFEIFEGLHRKIPNQLILI